MNRVGGEEPQEVSYGEILAMAKLHKLFAITTPFIEFSPILGVLTPPQSFRESLGSEFSKNGWNW